MKRPLEGKISITPIGRGEQVQKKVMRNFKVGKRFYLVFLEEDENECVRGKLFYYA